MIYPPPPCLIMLAYAYGSISGKERDELIELWHKKHDQPNEGDRE